KPDFEGPRSSIGHPMGRETGEKMHTALSEILPRGTPASGAEPSRETLVREIDAQTLAPLRRRAARLGIDFRQIGLAALALLDARLTGSGRVLIADPVSPASAREFTIPLDAEVDEWLRSAGRSNAQGGSADQASVIGTWAAGADATAARPPLAWCIDTAQDAQLRAEFDRSSLDRAAVELLAQALGSILRNLAMAQRLQQVSALDPELRSRLQVWNGPAVMHDPNDTVHGLFARFAQLSRIECPRGSNRRGAARTRDRHGRSRRGAAGAFRRRHSGAAGNLEGRRGVSAAGYRAACRAPRKSIDGFARGAGDRTSRWIRG